MLQSIWIWKLNVQLTLCIHLMRWLLFIGCLLGTWLWFFSSERVAADGPFTGNIPKPVKVSETAAFKANLEQTPVSNKTPASAGQANQQTESQIKFDNVGLVVGSTISNTFALEAADLDKDGDLDLISADESGSLIVWQNDGTPFSNDWVGHQIGVTNLPVGLAVGDLDNDGDLDLAVAHEVGPTIWQNDGSPFEGEWLSRLVGEQTVGAIRIADMNGDEALDIVTGGGLPWWAEPDENNRVTIWINPMLPFNQPWLEMDVGLAYYTVTSLDVGDLDKDSDNDIVIGTWRAAPVGNEANPVLSENWPDVYQVRAFRNDGDGDWTAFNIGRDPKYQTFALIPYIGFWGCTVSHVMLTDLDQDDDLDIVSSQEIECDYMVIGWQNDGTPFSGELWTPSAVAKGSRFNWLEAPALWTEAGDFDQDGDLDVVSAGRQGVQVDDEYMDEWEIILWENSGVEFGQVISDTTWIRHNLVNREEDVWTVRVVDFDQDNNPDLVSAVHANGPDEIRLWRNKRGSTAYLPLLLKEN